MPFAAPIIAGVAAGIGALQFTTVAIAIGIGLATAGLQFLQKALAPKPPSFEGLGDFAAQAQRRTATVRQPVTERRLPFGEVVLGGILTFYEATADNKTHHMVLVLGDAPVAPWDGIDAVWLDDTPVFPSEIDANGDVTAGKFDGKVRIKKHLGGPDQTADADLVGAVARLDASFRGRGVAYLYVRVDWDRDTFPNGLPDVRAWCRTNTVLDPRDGVRRWSSNAALALHEYATIDDPGLGYDAALDFDGAFTDSAANIGDEIAAAKPVGHAIVGVDAGSDELRLAVGGSGAPLRLETGDRVELFLAGGATAPGGLAAGTAYYAIVDRLVGAPLEGSGTTVGLSAADYTGAAATAIAAGDVDGTWSGDGGDIQAAVRLAASHADALARTAVDVTGAGSGQAVLIKTGEPRYTVSAVIETGRTPADAIEDLLSAMAGKLVWTGGVFRILPAAWRPPAAGLQFDESDLMGPLTVRTRHSRRERFNALKGLLATQLTVGELTDYPELIDAGSVTADGGRTVKATVDRPATSRVSTAQRLGKIDLARHRREIAVDYPTGPKGFRAVPGSTVEISNARRGWTNKTFEVIEVEDLEIEADGAGGGSAGSDAPRLQGATLRLRETDAAVFDFDPAADELVKRPEALPPGGNPLNVPANPTALAAFTDTIEDATGAKQHRILLAWEPAADAFVTGGGEYEIQWKRSAASLWQPSFFADGVVSQTLIAAAFPLDELIDLRVRSVNSVGRKAATWQQLLGFQVGTSGTGATGTTDFGLITEADDGTPVDYGLVTEADDGTPVDYGSLV